jgi:predicted ATPase
MIFGRLGGGKSTLLTALGRRGYITVEEMLGNGLALPWVDETAFARHTITLSLALFD